MCAIYLIQLFAEIVQFFPELNEHFFIYVAAVHNCAEMIPTNTEA